MALRKALKIEKVFVASNVKNIADVLRSSLQTAGLNHINVSVLPLVKSGQLCDECLAVVPEIEFLYADPSAISQILLHPKNKVKWIQNTFAGVERIFQALAKLEKMPDVILTRQTSGFGQSMAEYVIGQIVARERNFALMYDQQKMSLFDFSQLTQYRNLNELSLGILGLGNIGSEVARQCKAVNMKVWAMVRDDRFNAGEINHEHVHFIRPMSRISEMLQEVNYLVNVLPSTPQTRGLLNGDMLRPCQNKKTVFINVGRGDVIDDDSLINSIRCGWLGGAILDVFNQEPLPSSSPLWNLAGVTISPHVSGVTRTKEACETFINNIMRYESGEPLLNQVDLNRGY